jgi:hypothetical protein
MKEQLNTTKDPSARKPLEANMKALRGKLLNKPYECNPDINKVIIKGLRIPPCPSK